MMKYLTVVIILAVYAYGFVLQNAGMIAYVENILTAIGILLLAIYIGQK